MSDLNTPREVFFFFSILYRSDLFTKEAIIHKIHETLSIDLEFSHPHFPMKEYYSKEMGSVENLKRIFFVSTKLLDRKNLVDLKIWATSFEKDHLIEKNRSINLDVGFISLEQVILATGKPYYHRVYLDHGVYANLELFQNEDEFKVFPWTYPDYAHVEIRHFFNYCRNLLKNSYSFSGS